MLWLCIFTALDQHQTQSKENEWRDTLMRLFFLNISPEGQQDNYIDVVHDFTNGCYGVKCVDGAVTEVMFFNFKYGNFNINALPHSTVSIIIPECAQTFQIQTRSFPKKLRTINLTHNGIHGHLDLTTLPENLGVAFQQNNRLTGPISLVSLPRTLGRLEIQGNKISQETVWYANLPEGLHTLKLGRSSVKEVRAVSSGNIVKDKKIFQGMKSSSVH